MNAARAWTLPEIFLAGAFFLCPANRWIVLPDQLAISWSDVFLFAAALASLIAMAGARLPFRVPLFIIISALLIGVSGLATAGNDADVSSLSNCVKLILSMSLVPVAAMWITRGRQQAIDRMLVFWLAGAVLSALVAVFGVYEVSFLGLRDPRDVISGRGSGLAYHPNSLGYASALLLFVTLYLYLTARVVFFRWLCLAGAVLLIWAIQTSGSRGAVLAVAIAALAWFPNPQHGRLTQRQLLILSVGFAGIVALGLYIFLADRPFADVNSALGRMFSKLGDSEQSNSARKEVLRIGYEGFLSSPFVGQGYADIRGVHNFAIQMLYCGGLIGFLGALLWWSGMTAHWLRFRRGVNAGESRSDYLLTRLILSVALVILVVTALQPLMTDRNGYMLFGMLLGLSCANELRQPSFTASAPVPASPT